MNSPEEVTRHFYDGSTGMHANTKDVQSEQAASKKHDKKGSSRLTIAQGVANIEIFGNIPDQSNPSENEQSISRATAIKILNSNELRGSQQQQKTHAIAQPGTNAYFSQMQHSRELKFLTKSADKSEEGQAINPMR